MHRHKQLLPTHSALSSTVKRDGILDKKIISWFPFGSALPDFSKDTFMEFKRSCLSTALLLLTAPDLSLTFGPCCHRAFTLHGTIKLAQ